MSQSSLQKLSLVYLANAKNELADELFEQIEIPVLQTYLMMALECLPMEELLDPVLMRHAIDSLSSEYTAEETLLHIFCLYMYKRLGRQKVHPLELGVLKQEFQGLAPVFQRAVEQGKIKPAYHEQYHEMLVNMLEQTELLSDVLFLLKAEYERFSH